MENIVVEFFDTKNVIFLNVFHENNFLLFIIIIIINLNYYYCEYYFYGYLSLNILDSYTYLFIYL